MNNILVSMLGLVNNNGGKFKSEAQAKFLLSRCDGGVFSINERYAFGERGGCVRVVSYDVYCDAEGITKVLKNGEQVFPKTAEQLVKEEKRNARAEKKAADRKAASERFEAMWKEIDTYRGIEKKFADIAVAYLIREESKVCDSKFLVKAITSCYGSLEVRQFAELVHSEDFKTETAHLKRVANVAVRYLARIDRVIAKLKVKYYGE